MKFPLILALISLSAISAMAAAPENQIDFVTDYFQRSFPTVVTGSDSPIPYIADLNLLILTMRSKGMPTPQKRPTLEGTNGTLVLEGCWKEIGPENHMTLNWTPRCIANAINSAAQLEGQPGPAIPL